MASSSLWQRFQRYFLEYRDLGFSLDVSCMKFPDDLFEKMRQQTEHAFATMRELELRHLASNDPRIKVATDDEPADSRFSLGQSK